MCCETPKRAFHNAAVGGYHAASPLSCAARRLENAKLETDEGENKTVGEGSPLPPQTLAVGIMTVRRDPSLWRVAPPLEDDTAEETNAKLKMQNAKLTGDEGGGCRRDMERDAFVI